MKWSQLEEQLKDDQVDQSEWDNFKVYYNKTELEKDLEENYEEWVTYPNPDFPDDLPKKMKGNRKAQRKYEIFCGGFLYYHDFEFKKYDKKKFSHNIYFDWSNKKNSVTIYITKTPPEFNPTPPKPPAPPPPES